VITISKKSVAVLGAGNRGKDVYGKLIKQNKNLQISAVAEPLEDRRKKFAKEHKIPPNYQFESWEDLLFEKRLADGLIISTGDKIHFEPLKKALSKGYKVLCEKPITDDFNELKTLQEDYSEDSEQVMVSHVLRYTPFFKKIKELLNKNIIGRIRFINLIENIGFFHYGHSYVRGNWRNQEVGAPIILAKSCHDLDILYWLMEVGYKYIYSDSSERYFDKKYDPSQAGKRCLTCPVEDNCPYSAKKLYFAVPFGWPVNVITDNFSEEGITKALKETNYGKCVYKSDNDQLDVQTLLLKFKNEITAHFTLTAFSNDMTRKINIFGTHGEIFGDLEKGIIEVKPFLDKHYKINIEYKGGHAGGDKKLIESFAKFLSNKLDKNDSNLMSALESHFAALAAEKSRKIKSAVKLDEFRGYKK